MLAWTLSVALAVLCWHFRRQRDAARANAARVWDQCRDGLKRLGGHLDRLGGTAGR